MLARSNPELAANLLKEAQDDVERQWRVYSARAAMPGRGETPHIAPAEKPEDKPEQKLAAEAAGGTE
jgi:pyruvate-ferredoxin/flavodoxin oxidoreductase